MRYIVCQQCGNKFGEDDSNPSIHYSEPEKICLHCKINNEKPSGSYIQLANGEYVRKP